MKDLYVYEELLRFATVNEELGGFDIVIVFSGPPCKQNASQKDVAFGYRKKSRIPNPFPHLFFM